jgi:peptide/nickel transport system permease protein
VFRLLYAGRVSLSVGLVAVAIYTLIGVILGAFQGSTAAGWTRASARLPDIVSVVPALIRCHGRLSAGAEHPQHQS